MRYEQLVQFMSELPRTDFFVNPTVEAEYARKFAEYNVTDELMLRLDSEHTQIRSMSHEFKSLDFSAGPHKHDRIYITNKAGEMIAVCMPDVKK